MDKQTAEMFFDNSVSAVLALPKQKKTLLSLRLSNMSPEVAVNTSTHELEHVLFNRHSIRAKFERLYTKLRGQKWLAKYIEKYAQKINIANMNLQRDLIINGNMAPTAIGGHIETANLLEHMHVKTKDELTSVLTNIINHQKKPHDLKLNLKILKALRLVLKDESRAYKVGGRAERCYEAANAMIPEKGNTKSEVFAELYDLTIEQLKKDIKKARKARYKEIFSKIFHLGKQEKNIGLHYGPDI